MKPVPGRLSFWMLAISTLLILGGSFGLVTILKPAWESAQMAADRLTIPQAATSTPYQPQTQTPLPAPNVTQPAILAPIVAPVTPEPLPTAARPPHFAQALAGYPGQKVRLVLFPNPAVNGGNAIEMAFTPAPDCPFGSGTACISQHRGGQVVLATIHSGIGGEGETLRLALESTSLYGAGFTLKQIQGNLTAMQNIPVQLHLGTETVDGLTLAALARVPPEDLQAYFDLPYDEALEMVARENEPVRAVLDASEPLLVFEICGWYVQGEVWGSASSPTTASIYLGFIRR